MCVYYGKIVSVGNIISDKNFFFFEFTEKLENEFIKSQISDFNKERLEEVRRLMIKKTEENMSDNTGKSKKLFTQSYYKEKCQTLENKCRELEMDLFHLRNCEDKQRISFLQQRNEELLVRLQKEDQLVKEIDQLANSIQGLEGEKTELNAKLKLSETKIAVIEDLLVSYAYKLENYRRMKGEK